MVGQIEKKVIDASIKMLLYSLHGQKIEEDFFHDCDSDKIFAFCRKHEIAALASLCLAEKTGKWLEEYLLSVKRTILFDEERKNILLFFEENGIWYCPLKGIVIKDLYPEYGTRQMSDNDILVDPGKRKIILQYMKDRGYQIKYFEFNHHDSYLKKPIYNFEMHRFLFEKDSKDKSFLYYENVKERLLKDEGKNYAFRFSNEDFYLYYIAHNHKHLSTSGSGLRSLVDIYLYLEKHTDLDMAYIEQELIKLDLIEEEKLLRSLSYKLFSVDTYSLSKDEIIMLEYITDSGVYGKNKNLVQNRLNTMKKQNKNYKLSYIWFRLFPDEEYLRAYHYFFYKYKWARPFLMIYRGARILTKDPKRFREEMKILIKDGKEDD